MGNLFKHRSVRWIDNDGRRVSSNTPGAVKKIEKSKKWWGKFRDSTGEIRKVPLCKDKQSSEQALAELERKEERRKVGLVDRHTENAARPLSAHIQDWFQAMQDAGVSQRRRNDLYGRIQKILITAGWTRLADMTESSALAALAKLNVSIQTRNHYVQHIKQFSRWCVPDRLPFDPLAKLKGGNPNTDRRHDRRELTLEEQAKLISTTEVSPVIRYKLSGSSRAMLYDLAFATGFRRGELRSLTPESFDLDSETPTVTVAAAYSKHRRQDIQPLPVGFAKRIRAWLAAGNPLWPHLTHHTARMLKADLEAAGIPYVIQSPDGPLFADFHSTRHSFISAICRTDAPIKALVETARHGDPRLTLRRYAKIRLNDKANVVAQLDDPRKQQELPPCQTA